MLAMLPGRDTANYLQNGGPRTLKEAIAASGTVAAHSRALPSKQAFVVCKGRFYHWDTRCLLLSSAHEHSRLPVHEMTRAEAEKRGYLACGFCDRHDF